MNDSIHVKDREMLTPETAMVLAAGRGERLRPLTDTLPKPLVEIEGRTLLDHAIDRLAMAGVKRVVVNVHYLADQIVTHLKRRTSPEILISHEDSPLETGGGVVNALPLLGDQPFYVVNGDSLWLNGRMDALHRLALAWKTETTDAVLLLQRTVTAVGYDAETGDYLLDQLGIPTRRAESEVAPYVFAGVQLLSPRLFRNIAASKFSLNRIYDQAAESGRLRAIVHDGAWYHVGTPAGLELVRSDLVQLRAAR